MKSVLDRVPRHIQPMKDGMTQTRYARFLAAPEAKVRSVFDRVTNQLRLSDEAWKKNRYFEGENHD